MPDLSSYNTGSPIYSKQLHISRGNRSKGVEEEGGGKSMHPFFLVLEIEQGCVSVHNRMQLILTRAIAVTILVTLTLILLLIPCGHPHSGLQVFNSQPDSGGSAS